MKKILTAVCSLAIVLVSVLGLSGCKSNQLTYGKEYKLSGIGIMGFTGTKTDLSKYLELVDQSEDEINAYKEYINLVMDLSFSFNKNGTGSLAVRNFASYMNGDKLEGLTNPDTKQEIEELIELAKERNLYDEATGTLHLDFDYTKSGNKVALGYFHTGIENFNNSFGMGKNGDIRFVDALGILTIASGNIASFTNSDANILTLKNNELQLSLFLEAKYPLSTEDSDNNVYRSIIATEIRGRFGA